MWNLEEPTNRIRRKLNKIYTFCSYWYMRYLLVTELYIVESWERALMHAVMMIFLCVLSYVNIHLIDFLGSIIYFQKESIYLEKMQ